MALATPSRDGEPRIDLRIPVRLSKTQVARAIAIGSEEGTDIISRAGRVRLLSWARAGIKNHGIDICSESIEGYEEEVEAAALRLVHLGVFPDTSTQQH